MHLRGEVPRALRSRDPVDDAAEDLEVRFGGLAKHRGNGGDGLLRPGDDAPGIGPRKVAHRRVSGSSSTSPGGRRTLDRYRERSRNPQIRLGLTGRAVYFSTGSRRTRRRLKDYGTEGQRFESSRARSRSPHGAGDSLWPRRRLRAAEDRKVPKRSRERTLRAVQPGWCGDRPRVPGRPREGHPVVRQVPPARRPASSRSASAPRTPGADARLPAHSRSGPPKPRCTRSCARATPASCPARRAPA